MTDIRLPNLRDTHANSGVLGFDESLLNHQPDTITTSTSGEGTVEFGQRGARLRLNEEGDLAALRSFWTSRIGRMNPQMTVVVDGRESGGREETWRIGMLASDYGSSRGVGFALEENKFGTWETDDDGNLFVDEGTVVETDVSTFTRLNPRILHIEYDAHEERAYYEINTNNAYDRGYVDWSGSLGAPGGTLYLAYGNATDGSDLYEDINVKHVRLGATWSKDA